ncbi:hypothetical protein VTJ04DRAFT_4032 [Mycothermus thermophilus]|uniref:uncharacterized protein n=1 Tax=Humicola insolens TaxID=85995 RepID=UPI003743DC1B
MYIEHTTTWDNPNARISALCTRSSKGGFRCLMYILNSQALHQSVSTPPNHVTSVLETMFIIHTDTLHQREYYQ